METHKINLQVQYQALKSNEVNIILERCQKYIERMSESKFSSDEIRGMIRLLKHIKDIEAEYLKEQS